MKFSSFVCGPMQMGLRDLFSYAECDRFVWMASECNRCSGGLTRKFLVDERILSWESLQLEVGNYSLYRLGLDESFAGV